MTAHVFDPSVLPVQMSERRAAELLDISIDTLRRIRKRREIAFRKVGARVRYTPADLNEYMENRKIECQNASPSLADAGSQNESGRRTIKSHGSTRTPAKRDASAQARAIFAPRKSSSPSTSH